MESRAESVSHPTRTFLAAHGLGLLTRGNSHPSVLPGTYKLI